MSLYSWKARHAWETTRTRGTNSTGGPRGTVITTVTVLAGDSRHASRSRGSRGTTGAWVTGLTTHTLEPLWTWGTWGTWTSPGTDRADLGLQVAEGVGLYAGTFLAALGLCQLREPWREVRGGSGGSWVAGDAWGAWSSCEALFPGGA